jgi:mannose-1-phosphate guanylyltransferase
MATVWPELEKVAIDYAVAEPAAELGRMLVIPGEFGWDDVGDFAALARMHAKGPGDLAVLGENTMVLSDSSSGIVVSQSKRLVSLIGVDDIVIVDTPDALLVTTKKNAQRVKSVVDVLKINNQGDIL